MTGGDLDACRDAAALLAATARHDHEGRQVILDHGDTRQIAGVLAIVLAAACRGAGPGFIDEVCAALRDYQDDTP